MAGLCCRVVSLQVNEIYHDESLGVHINVVLVRMIMLGYAKVSKQRRKHNVYFSLTEQYSTAHTHKSGSTGPERDRNPCPIGFCLVNFLFSSDE